MKKHYRILKLVVQIGIGALLVLGGLENLPVTLLIILVSTVLAGPIFCGWACPFGTLQDLVSYLSRGVKKRHMPKGLQKGLAVSRYILLGVTTLLTADFVFSLMALDARINLLSIFSGNILTIGAYGVLAAYLLIAVFYERPFCSFMCPQGAKYGLMSSLRPFRVSRNESACVNCGKCNQVCPMHIDIMGHKNVTSLQCISCMNCVVACPKKGVLKFGVIKLGRKGLVAYFIAVILAVGSLTGFAAYQMSNEAMAITAAEEEAMTAVQEEVQEGTSDTVISDTAKASVPQATSKTTPQTQTQNTTQKQTQTQNTIQTTPVTQTTTAVTQTSATGSQDAGTTSAPEAAVQQTVTGAAAGLSDGTYTGEARGFRGPITVAVTVQNQQIASIDVVDNMDDRKWFNRALSVIEDMLATQSTDVDTVTGATYSSRGIINAAKAALSNAK